MSTLGEKHSKFENQKKMIYCTLYSKWSVKDQFNQEVFFGKDFFVLSCRCGGQNISMGSVKCFPGLKFAARFYLAERIDTKMRTVGILPKCKNNLIG